MRRLIPGLLLLGVLGMTSARAEHVFLESLGRVEGPRFLDGRTHNGTVGLAPNTAGGFTGTRWSLLNLDDGTFNLECLGAVEGPRFLDGRTHNGTVGLALRPVGASPVR